MRPATPSAARRGWWGRVAAGPVVAVLGSSGWAAAKAAAPAPRTTVVTMAEARMRFFMPSASARRVTDPRAGCERCVRDRYSGGHDVVRTPTSYSLWLDALR